MLRDFFQKYKMIIIVGVIILTIIFGSSIFTAFKRPIKLTVWGSDLSSDEFDVLSKNVTSIKGQSIKFTYREIKPELYEKELLDAFIKSESPDIFLINSEQFGKFKKLITPLDLKNKEYTLTNLKQDYPTIIADNAVINNQLYVAPIAIDSLVMYYNRNIFDTLSIANPPKTWDDFLKLVPILRQLDSYNRIVRSPIAMGVGSGITNSADILSLLIMQLNGQIVDTETQKAMLLIRAKFNGKTIDASAEALKFYTQFSQANNQYYSWDTSFGNDLTAFANNKLAVYFGYKTDAEKIIAKNSNLNFGIAAMPQISLDNNVNFGKFFGLSVSSQTTNPNLTWDIIKLLLRTDNVRTLVEFSKVPPANRALIDEYYNDDLLNIFVKQALSSKTFFHPDNILTKNAFIEIIDEVRYSNDYRDAIQTLNQNLTNILYNN